MIEIGKHNKLKILRETSVGLFLGDESGEDVLLPNKYCPEEYELDDEIEVFVYRDYAERKIATNIQPKILLNQFALLEVTDISAVGAFLDWGLEKDLLVPFKEQRQKMKIGRWYVVFLEIDSQTDRLYASNKIEKRLQNDFLYVDEGDEVELMVYHKTDLGFSVIVNQIHKGLLYDNEIFKELKVGDKLKGYVKNIREDKKLDISLQPLGYRKTIDPNSKIILNALLDNNGYLNFTDKSSPEEISANFGMSKKAFKKAIGALYKERKIILEKNGLKLAESI
jgi:predicted RNA-binding protein (virulence factor B family)